MRILSTVRLLALLVVAFAVLVVVNAPSSTVEAAPQAADPGIQAVGTAEPTRVRPYRSYPAPTGYPGFRLYYQNRCYPGCHYGSTVATPEPERERPYRSYPAPTGYPGFRLYYQKRCYPGCHYGTGVQTPEAATPVPTRIHP